jgi:ribosomal protein L19E
MNLKKKKSLASKTLKVGRERIIFSKQGLEEIKNAITKQDIIQLYKEGIIKIKEPKGRKTVVKKKGKRGKGKIKKKVNKRKEEYVILTRKLRKHVAELKKQGEISNQESKEIRKKIRNKFYKNKSHLKDQLKIRK